MGERGDIIGLNLYRILDLKLDSAQNGKKRVVVKGNKGGRGGGG